MTKRKLQLLSERSAWFVAGWCFAFAAVMIVDGRSELGMLGCMLMGVANFGWACFMATASQPRSKGN